MSYRGQLERVTIDCHNDGWIVLHLGLRNLTLEIAQTQLSRDLSRQRPDRCMS